MTPSNSNEIPNQVCVTLTTHRDGEGRVTGTSCSRAIKVPAHQDMNPPDLSALTKGDEEYLLVKVSRNKRRCWVTYLDGEDPDVEREFYIGTTVSGLMRPNPMAPRQATRDFGSPRASSPEPPQPPRLARVQLGEMVERRIEEGTREMMEKRRESTRVQCTREGTHTRFRMQAPESGGEGSVPRESPPLCEDLEKLTDYFNPFVGSPWGEG